MSSPVRRAGAFAVVGSLALVVPLFEAAGAAPFAVIAAAAVLGLEEGPVFDLFARPGEHRERRLYGLIGFTLAASGLALLAAVTPMPVGVGVGTILLVAYGNLAAQAVRTRYDAPVAVATAFAAGGGLAYLAGHAVAIRVGESAVTAGVSATDLAAVAPELVFLAASGALLGALLRTLLLGSDDPHVMLSVGLWLWLLSALAGEVSATAVALALGVTVVLGYLSYALETASISGMLTGVSMALVTVVLGGVGWFLVLVAFFGIGGLSTKFRYERKRDRGVAETDDGARSTANVLANGAVGLLAVLCYAAARTSWEVGLVTVPAVPRRELFVFAFVGSVATAMSDTLSSEIGGTFDDVRLITTLEPVEPGTDGGVTWQGLVAGLAGALVVGAVAAGSLEPVATAGVAGVAVVVAAGFLGTVADSLLGATVEGWLVGNGGVNLLATLVGGLVAAAGAALV